MVEHHAIDFAGRVVVVTGGGNGLGRAYCLALDERGATVIVNDRGTSIAGAGHSTDPADQVVTEIRKAGGKALANHDDVATRHGGTSIVEAALDNFGRVDALINNAGFLTEAVFEDMSDAQIDAMLDVHLKGAFHVTQPAFRAMRAAGYGRIVFTGSSSGMFGHVGHAGYGAAKAGIAGLMNVVALEGQPHGIQANLIMPNAVTRISQVLSDTVTQGNEAFAASMRSVDFAPLLPSVTPEFAAPLVVYLASEACRSSHNLYSQAGDRYARVFIGVTKGWESGRDAPPSAEAIARHWSLVEDRETYHMPMTNYDELAIVSPVGHAGHEI